MALNFANVKLKKAEAPSKERDLKKEMEEAKKQQMQLETVHQRVREADLESWYFQLEDLTYKTSWLSLTVAEGKAIVDTFLSHKHGKEPTPESKEVILNLEKKVDEAISKVAFLGEGVFVKLSSRSPKDATTTGEKTEKIFFDLLSANGKTPSNNDKLVAVMRAHIAALKTSSGKEALTTILQSERVYEDMTLSLEKPETFSQKVIIRQWNGIPVEYEIRAFFYKKKLTAMCQYYHYCYFPEMVKKKEEILRLVQEFAQGGASRVPLESFVLDLAVDVEKGKVWVIEINPFNDFEGAGTSGAMFSWNLDRKVLFGEEPFQYRVEERVHEDIFKNLTSQWKEMFEKADKKFGSK